jgi:hypothetical protein
MSNELAVVNNFEMPMIRGGNLGAILAQEMTGLRKVLL